MFKYAKTLYSTVKSAFYPKQKALPVQDNTYLSSSDYAISTKEAKEEFVKLCTRTLHCRTCKTDFILYKAYGSLRGPYKLNSICLECQNA